MYVKYSVSVNCWSVCLYHGIHSKNEGTLLWRGFSRTGGGIVVGVVCTPAVKTRREAGEIVAVLKRSMCAGYTGTKHPHCEQIRWSRPARSRGNAVKLRRFLLCTGLLQSRAICHGHTANVQVSPCLREQFPGSALSIHRRPPWLKSTLCCLTLTSCIFQPMVALLNHLLTYLILPGGTRCWKSDDIKLVDSAAAVKNLCKRYLINKY